MKFVALFLVVCLPILAERFIGRADEKADDKKTDAKTHTVTMKSLGYDPRNLEIRVGDSVVWMNKARTAHTATSEDDGKTFDIGPVDQDTTSKPVKFEKEGEFKYHCKVHGKVMSGTIVVKAAEK
jgi:plastocyanin